MRGTLFCKADVNINKHNCLNNKHTLVNIDSFETIMLMFCLSYSTKAHWSNNPKLYFFGGTWVLNVEKFLDIARSPNIAKSFNVTKSPRLQNFNVTKFTFLNFAFLSVPQGKQGLG